MSRPYKMKLAVFLMLSTALIGCSDNDDEFTIVPEQTASIRVLHASPDAPNVDVLVDDQVVLSDVPYKAASEFLLVERGSRNIKVNATGTSTTVIDANLDLVRDSFTTVVATNFLAKIEPLVLPDEGSPPSGSALRVRVLHSSPSAPPVDVYVTAPGTDITAEAPTLSNVAFQSFSDFLEIPEGDYQIRLTVAGDKTPVYDSGSTALAAGSIFTVVAVDAASGGTSPVSLVLLTNDPTTPYFQIDDSRARLRAVHASPDAPNVDILVDGQIVAADIAYKGFLDYAPLPPGNRNIKVDVSGTSTSVIDVTQPLAAGVNYTVLAVGLAATSTIEALPLVDDLTRPAPGSAKVRVVHASPDAPNVDVLVDDTIVLSNVAFKEFSDYLEVPAGVTNFKVNATGTALTVIDVTPTLDDGGIYTVIAVGQLATASIEPLLLFDN